MSGYVYVIHNGSGMYKIGCTSGPIEKRLTTLQTSNSSRLELILTIESNNFNSLEKELHSHFNEKRVTGEWFSLSEDDLLYLHSLDNSKDERIPDHFYIKQDALIKIFLNPRITRESMRVLSVLLLNVSSGNRLNISQKDIAAKLEVDSQRVSRSIKNLLEESIINKGERIGNAFIYYLSREIGQKEKPVGYDKQMDALEKAANKMNARKSRSVRPILRSAA